MVESTLLLPHLFQLLLPGSDCPAPHQTHRPSCLEASQTVCRPQHLLPQSRKHKQHLAPHSGIRISQAKTRGAIIEQTRGKKMPTLASKEAR